MTADAGFGEVERLLRAAGQAARTELERAQDAIATLVRLQTAQGLAAEFTREDRPYERNAALARLIDEGLLERAAFIQKRPFVLQFYKRLLFALDREPRTILEIGVKGGASTAFWKALFPSCRVVGLDIKLQRWLVTGGSAPDGVVYEQGDQADEARLQAIAREHGPFDIVIDDGSHRSEHQAATLVALLPHVSPGGFHVIEDVHANLKNQADGHKTDYGSDIWPDFVLALFERLRRGPVGTRSAGADLAQAIAKRTDELILGKRILAIRVAGRGQP